MASLSITTLLEKVAASDEPRAADLAALLRLEAPAQVAALYACANEIRHCYVGDEILLRGLVEFSNVCTRTCRYCGLNRYHQHLRRYRLSRAQILGCARATAACRVKTMVLQAGENPALNTQWLAEVIATIKQRHGLAVTLSVGERPEADYRVWKAAGADRYLIKIETSRAALYARHHPGMSLPHRLRCTQTLQRLGYQTGSGCIFG